LSSFLVFSRTAQNATPEATNTLYTLLYPAALIAVSAAIVLANLGHVRWLGVGGSVIAVCDGMCLNPVNAE
jgi:hypothetical protein